MKGLMKKEWLIVTGQMKAVCVVYLCFMIFCAAGNNWYMLSIYPMILGTSLVLSLFTFDRVNHWELFAMGMPVDRRMLVNSRYAAVLMLNLCLFLIGGALAFLMALVTGNDLETVGVSLLSAVAVVMFMQSILLPLVYQMGEEKARYAMVVIWVVIMGGLGYLLMQGRLSALIESLTLRKLWMIPAALAVIAWLSWRLSQAIYEKKEF